MNKFTVITYCSNYDYYVYERFAGQLFDTGFTGDLVFICKSNDIDKINKLKENINTNISYYIDNINSPYSPNCKRYTYYKKIIEETKSEFYLLCDSRDVIFQKNIQEYHFDKNSIYFFKENISFIQDQTYNLAWIKMIETFTKENFVEKIKNNKVICSGTTFGNYTNLLKYIEKMLFIMNKYNLAKPHRGIDQGIHNYLYYTNKLDISNINVLDNNDILINTLGAPLSLKINQLISYKIIDGKIYDTNNNLNYIVHQYDRMSLDERKLLNNKYNFIDR